MQTIHNRKKSHCYRNGCHPVRFNITSTSGFGMTWIMQVYIPV